MRSRTCIWNTLGEDRILAHTCFHFFWANLHHIEKKKKRCLLLLTLSNRSISCVSVVERMLWRTFATASYFRRYRQPRYHQSICRPFLIHDTATISLLADIFDCCNPLLRYFRITTILRLGYRGWFGSNRQGYTSSCECQWVFKTRYKYIYIYCFCHSFFFPSFPPRFKMAKEVH